MSLYRFRSKADGDLIMMGPQGDSLLRIIGREPAPQGILEAGTLPAAIAALERAVAAEEASRNAAPAEAAASGEGGGDAVSLRQRVWPMLEMMRRSKAEGADIVWGV